MNTFDLKRDKTRLTRERPGRGTPVFERLCASEVLQPAVSVEAGDGDPCSSKDLSVIDVLETTGVPENTHVGIRASASKKVARPIAQVKFI